MGLEREGQGRNYAILLTSYEIPKRDREIIDNKCQLHQTISDQNEDEVNETIKENARNGEKSRPLSTESEAAHSPEVQKIKIICN